MEQMRRVKWKRGDGEDKRKDKGWTLPERY